MISFVRKSLQTQTLNYGPKATHCHTATPQAGLSQPQPAPPAPAAPALAHQPPPGTSGPVAPSHWPPPRRSPAAAPALGPAAGVAAAARRPPHLRPRRPPRPRRRRGGRPWNVGAADAGASQMLKSGHRWAMGVDSKIHL